MGLIFLIRNPLEKLVTGFIQDVLLDKKPKPYLEPVCYSCTLKENDCLIEKGSCLEIWPRMVKIRDSISDLIRFCSIKQTYFAEL